ncbi:MAG TPA: YhjD/YihY/BrkB family envelope integrity protein, partial [Nitrospiraceae bacterium]|nr:YhjD/YihY/BrkB family envelope integrity protein [Nitrospiraceae bacterium]
MIEDRRFERFIVGAIVINAITLGIETSSTAKQQVGGLLHLIDQALLAIFVVEIIAKMAVYGRQFWRDPWSLFDLAVISITVMPASDNLSILRSLRILRAMRLVSAIPSLRRVVSSLLSAVPSMGSIILLLLLINYVFSVMTTKLFGQEFEKYFGTLGESFFTFFQIMTLEGWANEVVRPVMEKHPWAWLLFVPYIVLTSFMVLNLFIGIVVDAMQQQNTQTRQAVIEVTETDYNKLMAEIGTLRAELRLMKGGEHLRPWGLDLRSRILAPPCCGTRCVHAATRVRHDRSTFLLKRKRRMSMSLATFRNRMVVSALAGLMGQKSSSRKQSARFEAHDGERGRDAETPSQIPAKGWKDIAWRVYEGMQQDRVLLIAAGVTFYSLLAAFPAMAAGVALYGLIADPHTISQQFALLAGIVPDGALQVLGDQVNRLLEQSTKTLGFALVAGLAVSLWGANAATKAIF